MNAVLRKRLVALVLGVGLCGAGIAARTAQTDDAPRSPSLAKDARVFEMRTYYAAPGKFEAMHARFRDHTNRLFKKHGMTLVGYWVPTSKEQGSENTLIYLLSFPNREAANKSWAAFIADPEWKTARDASEVNGKLVDRIVSVYMNPTDYSPIK